MKARKAHLNAEMLFWKQKRLAHLLLERADKVSYYTTRQMSRLAGSNVISCIIDKMDGNKNVVPSFVRPPKGAAEDLLKDCLKMHVVGVIFHGNPDRCHLFFVCPHLSGNSNLNIECLLRALHLEFSEHGMLPVWHVQVFLYANLCCIEACSFAYPYLNKCSSECHAVG